MIDDTLHIHWHDQYGSGEWAAKSNTELGRYTIGYVRNIEGDHNDLRRFTGLQTAVDGSIQPVKWMEEIPEGVNTTRYGERLLSDWLGFPAPELRESSERELINQSKPYAQWMANLTGKSHCKAVEEYRQASAEQRASFGAKLPVRHVETPFPKKPEREIYPDI